MKTPKTGKKYLELLIQIANDSVYNLRGVREDEESLIALIRADIQNTLGENQNVLNLRGLDYTGYLKTK